MPTFHAPRSQAWWPSTKAQRITAPLTAADGLTEAIAIDSGVKQGCTMSPTVFNLILEPVPSAVVASGGGYKLAGPVFMDLNYADDMGLIATSPKEMRILLNSAEVAATAIGLTYNPKKSATLYLKSGVLARLKKRSSAYRMR